MVSSRGNQPRSFERYALDVRMEISGTIEGGEPFSDQAVMENVSGGGVCILTDRPDYYSDGQIVQLCLHLPALEHEEPAMSTRARVAWVKLATDSNAEARVGITLIDCFNFQRHLPGSQH